MIFKLRIEKQTDKKTSRDETLNHAFSNTILAILRCVWVDFPNFFMKKKGSTFNKSQRTQCSVFAKDEFAEQNDTTRHDEGRTALAPLPPRWPQKS